MQNWTDTSRDNKLADLSGVALFRTAKGLEDSPVFTEPFRMVDPCHTGNLCWPIAARIALELPR
jgi:hypothetical protein